MGRSAAFNIISMPRERNTADDSLVWLACPVTPSSIVVKATIVVSIPKSDMS